MIDKYGFFRSGLVVYTSSIFLCGTSQGMTRYSCLSQQFLYKSWISLELDPVELDPVGVCYIPLEGRHLAAMSSRLSSLPRGRGFSPETLGLGDATRFKHRPNCLSVDLGRRRRLQRK